MKTYRVIDALALPDGRRLEVGALVAASELPKTAVVWLLKGGHLEEVTDECPLSTARGPAPTSTGTI